MTKLGTNKITEGVIYKEVLWLFIPIVISAFFQHLYTFVDGMIIGEYLGTTAFSAVGGSSSKIITMLINFFVGVSGGITAYTARFCGSKDIEGVKKVIFNGVSFFAILGIILSAVGIIFSDNILSLMSTPVETFELSGVYLRTYLFGLVFCIIYNALTGVLRALGDAKRPLYVLIMCSFINIALDLLFVVKLNMGVAGVAIATLIAQGTSAIILMIMLYKVLPKTQKMKFEISIKMIKEICEIGIPAGLQSIMYSISNILVQSAINGFGYVIVAGWSAYVTIDNIVGMFVSALGVTVITFVGQNLGAGNIERVKQSVKEIIRISYIITIVLMVVFMFFRAELMSLFTNEQEVINIGSKLMFVIMPMHLIGIRQTMLMQALRGLGKSFMPMVLTIIGVIGVRIIWVTFILPMSPNVYFLGACYPISAFIMSVIFTIYYNKEIKLLENKSDTVVI